MKQLIVEQNVEYTQKINLANKEIQAQEGEKQKMFKDSGDMFHKLWGYMSESERAKALAEMNENQTQV
jgi:hypothetical protein